MSHLTSKYLFSLVILLLSTQFALCQPQLTWTETERGIEQERREMIGAISVTKTTAQGTGIGEALLFETLNITVQAKDNTGANITTGGEIFQLNVLNNCEIVGFNQCDMTESASDMILTPALSEMTDNTDGTYSGQYTAAISGNATVIIYLFNLGEAHVEIYDGVSFDKTVTTTETWTQISKNIPDVSTVYSNANGISISVFFLIKGPDNETVTFEIETEGGAEVVVDGTNTVSQLGSTCSPCTNTFNIAMKDDEFAEFRINYNKKIGTGDIQLRWKSASLGPTFVLVPNTHIYTKRMVGESPYSCEIKCQEFYTEKDPDHPGVCYEICGDGIRVDSETCDDKNTDSGDGCDETCRIIEENYVCDRTGNELSKDKCVPCKHAYEPNSEQRRCTQSGIEEKQSMLAYFVLILVFFEMGLNLFYICATKSSWNTTLTMINFCQMCVLLILFDASLNLEILKFLQKLSVLLFHFGDIPRGFLAASIPGCNELTRTIDFCSLTQLMKFESRSTWTILCFYFFIFLILFTFHGIVMLKHRKETKREAEESTEEIDENRCSKKLYKLTTFTIYVPIFKALFMTFVISSFTEICSTLIWDGVNFGSSLFALMVWAGCTAILAVTGWQFFKSEFNYTFHKMIYFRQLFSGLKIRWRSRSLPFIFFARIYGFVTIIVISNIFKYNIMVYVIILQTFYVMMCIYSTPYMKIKYNIILIVNELSYAVLLCFTLRSRAKTGLSSSLESTFMGIIVVTVGIACIVSFVTLLLFCCKRTYTKIKAKLEVERTKTVSIDRPFQNGFGQFSESNISNSMNEQAFQNFRQMKQSNKFEAYHHSQEKPTKFTERVVSFERSKRPGNNVSVSSGVQF